MSKTWKDSRDLRSSKFDRDRAKAERKRVKQQRKLARMAESNDSDSGERNDRVMATFDDSWAD